MMKTGTGPPIGKTKGSSSGQITCAQSIPLIEAHQGILSSWPVYESCFGCQQLLIFISQLG